MTGLRLTMATVERVTDCDRESERRWRPWRVGTFAGVTVTVINPADRPAYDPLNFGYCSRCGDLGCRCDAQQEDDR